MALDLQSSMELKNEAAQSIDQMADVAGRRKMTETEKALRTRKEQLLNDTFRIMLAGRFRNGKSTLLNALLGNPTVQVPGLPPGKGPMPVEFVPTTAVLTSVTYSERPYVKMWTFDGQCEEWSFERYLRDAKVKPDDEENQKFFANVREFEVGFPAEICRQGVTIIDAPGMDDMPQRSDITNAAAKTCDAAIVVYRNDVLAGGEERKFVENVLTMDGTYNFTVVNLFHGKEPDEVFKAFAWARLVKLMRGGPSYSGQDFKSQDIYFVDAQKAQEGVYNNDKYAVQQSGLELVEKRLAEYLTNERQRQHIERFVKGAQRITAAIDEQMQRESISLKADYETIHRTYDEAKPGLEKVRERTKRIPEIFAKYRRRAKEQAAEGFERLILQIEMNLPALAENLDMPSAGGKMAMFKQKQMVREAFEGCQKIISSEINAWAAGPNGKLTRLLQSIVDDMMHEIEQEVAQIENAYRQFYIDIAGPELGGGDSSTHMSWFERAAWVAAGFLAHDITLAFGGGTLGWRGALATVGGWVGAAVAAGMLGITGIALVPLTLIFAFAANWIVGQFWLANRVKERVITTIIEGSPKSDPPMIPLRDWPIEAKPRLENSIDAEFGKLQKAMMQSISVIIEEEQRSIEKVIEDSRRKASEKSQMLAEIEADKADLARARKRLDNVVVSAKQTMA